MGRRVGEAPTTELAGAGALGIDAVGRRTGGFAGAGAAAFPAADALFRLAVGFGADGGIGAVGRRVLGSGAVDLRTGLLTGTGGSVGLVGASFSGRSANVAGSARWRTRVAVERFVPTGRTSLPRVSVSSPAWRLKLLAAARSSSENCRRRGGGGVKSVPSLAGADIPEGISVGALLDGMSDGAL